MRILSWKKSELDNSLIVANVKCSKCGHVGQTTCRRLSDLHYAVCSACGNIDVERKDGRLYKDAANMLGVKTSCDSDKVICREGIERIIRSFNRMMKSGLVDKAVFEDKEAFVRWSIEHGYRDWKVLVVNPNTGLVDSGASWVVSGYGTKDFGNKEDSNEAQAYVSLARYFGVAIEDSIDKLSKAVDKKRETVDKWRDLKSKREISEMERRLKRVEIELIELRALLDKEFV